MKRLLYIAIVTAALCGCRQPYHEAVLVDINTNEVPFLINQEETTRTDSQASVSDEERVQFLTSQLVQSRRVEIAHRWKDTGYNYTKYVTGWDGKWIPTQRLILVDTSPETVEWAADANKGTSSKDQGIWVESSDSVGFSTGISLTARIEGQADAVRFLHNYPPQHKRDVFAADGRTVIMEVDVTRIREILDTEIRARVLSVYADEAAEYTMDELRDKKRELMDAVKTDVIPYFKDRGITITTIGQFGGFSYENPAIQEAIDKVFQAQQDEEVAIAESKAAEQRKQALKLTGEGEAAKILEERRGESEGIRLVAEAKAYELEQLSNNPEAYMALKKLEIEMERLKVWDGRYPHYYFQTGGTDSAASPQLPTLMLQVPQQAAVD